MKTFLAYLTFVSALTVSAVFGQGTAFTYQGRLTDGTNAANGRYDLTFALFNASSGCCQQGTTITNTATVVTNGIFTVTLDFGSSAFTGASLWMEIAARTNGNAAFLTFTTRQPLTPSPYALFAPTAGGVTSGAITTAMLANGSVTSGKLAANAVTSASLTNTISLGNAGLDGRLDIYRTAAGGPAISLFGASNQISIYGESDNLEKVRLAEASGLGELLLNNNFGFQGAALLGNFFNGGGLLILNGTNGQNRAVLDGGSGGGKVNLYNSSSANTVSLNSAGSSWLTGGNVGIGTTAPAAGSQLHLFGFQGTALFESSGSANGSVLQLKNDNSSPTLLGAINFLDHNNNTPGQIAYLGSDRMDFRVGSTAAMSIDTFHDLLLYNSGGLGDILLNPGGGSGGQLWLSANGTIRVQMIGSATTGGSAYFNRPSDGTATVSIVADDGTGTGSGLITTSVLQITGGADLSEQFDVREIPDHASSMLRSVAPGMVVCIDAEHPGQLMVSTKPYDRTVAGIVSGAGGVKTGMMMGHQGTVADGKHPIALTGRVYCLADASNGPIQPGDLLTTAATPGHAMRVTDAARAQGAILGKAMSSLQKDKGLVLVLVTLQ